MDLNLWMKKKVNNQMNQIQMMTGKANVKTEELKEEIIECLELKINMIHQVLLMLTVKKLFLLEMKNNMSQVRKKIIINRIKHFFRN